MDLTKLKMLVDGVSQCQESCYLSEYSDKNKSLNVFDNIINQALLLVYETRTKSNPYGLISQKKAFKKLNPLPTGVKGRKLACQLGPGLGLLRLHDEVGKNWILTELGLSRVQNILQNSWRHSPLIDQLRDCSTKKNTQSILFVSEAPSKDAWEKCALVDKKNIFLIKSLLPHLRISFDEFKKYFFWVHYSNCFPGVTPTGSPKKPKNSKCYDKHTVHFVKDIEWKGIILMGGYAYKALNRSESMIKFLIKNEAVPSKLLPETNIPIMVLPHCSGRNTKARNELGEKYNILWSNAKKFVKSIIG